MPEAYCTQKWRFKLASMFVVNAAPLFVFFFLLAWSTVIISSTCTSPKSHVLTELWLVTENVKVGGSRAK